MMPGGRHPGFLESFGYALRGIGAILRRERNVKVMLAVGVLAVVAGFVLRIDALSWVFVILMIGLVLAGEMMNTAIEAVVDLASPDIHPLAKLAKDVAAGAMLVLSIAVAIGGLIVYGRAALALFG